MKHHIDITGEPFMSMAKPMYYEARKGNARYIKCWTDREYFEALLSNKWDAIAMQCGRPIEYNWEKWKLEIKAIFDKKKSVRR